MTLLWVFAGGGKLFVYQSSVAMLAYSYGVLRTRDLFKVGAVLTVIEGLFIVPLVTLYWPLIGLSWRPVSQPPAASTLAGGVYVQGPAQLHVAGIKCVQAMWPDLPVRGVLLTR